MGEVAGPSRNESREEEALEKKAGLRKRGMSRLGAFSERVRLDLEEGEVMRPPPQRKIGVGTPKPSSYVHAVTSHCPVRLETLTCAVSMGMSHKNRLLGEEASQKVTGLWFCLQEQMSGAAWSTETSCRRGLPESPERGSAG